MPIDGKTRLVVLLGNPVAHSRSPQMHNAAFAAQGLNYVYVALPVEPAAIAKAIAGLRALNIAGANVTIPHKQAVIPFLDELTDRARAVGAVNTIVRDGDRLRGDNTDIAGFLQPLQSYADRLRGANLVVFGAGGASRAVVYALLTAFEPRQLVIVARRLSQAEHLAQDFAAYDKRHALRTATFAEAMPAVRSSRLLVNATPLGMHPHTDATPWSHAHDFSSGQIAYDLVYAPSQTRFLSDATLHGALAIGGFGMLLGQAAAAYEQWTGHEMPLAVVRAAVG